jgi:glycosyltransferase involved in cell wall biosynthesis
MTQRQLPSRRVAYLLKRFPRLSETFILHEILELERQGLDLHLFSIKNPGEEMVHADVGRVRAPVTYLPTGRQARWAMLLAHLALVRRGPRRYVRTLLSALRYRRRSVVRRFFQAGYFADLLRRQPVDHLHAHFATAPTLLTMFVHQLTGIPYTFTTHAKDIYVDRDRQPELLRAQLQHCEAMVTVSEYNRRYLLSQLGPAAHGKVQRIYNGLDLHRFTYQQPSTAAAETPVILSICRLVEKKGLGDLLAAVDILRRRGSGFRVEIIGAGPLQPTLEAEVMQRGLEDVVTFLGALPQEEVRQAYRRATVFALPCIVTSQGDRDGIPTVLLEAMASGVPVVSTAVSGIPELIDAGHDGLLVGPHDPGRLADALGLLLADAELRDRLARAARSKIEADFAIERSSQQSLALFRQARAG